jgi:MFS family permease
MPVSSLRSRSIRQAIAISVVGRIPNGVVPLAVVLLAHERLNSLATGGAAAGAYALGAAIASPLAGRVVRLLAERQVVIATGVTHAALLVALAHLPIGGSRAAFVTLAALTGISRPPLAPLGRAFFGRRASNDDELAAALAVDAAATEAIYVLGPLLTSAATYLATAGGALDVAASVTIVGSLGYARLVRRQEMPTLADRRAVGALASATLRRLVMATTLLGIGYGLLEVGIPGVAVDRGQPGLSGIPLAALAAGTLVSSLVYGARSRRRAPIEALPSFFGAYAVAIAAVAVFPNLLVASVALAAAGVALGPLTVATFRAVDHAVLPAAAAEGYGWITTANVGGSAAGAAAAGFLIEQLGLYAPFALAGLGAATGGLLLLDRLRAIARLPEAPGRAEG